MQPLQIYTFFLISKIFSLVNLYKALHTSIYLFAYQIFIIILKNDNKSAFFLPFIFQFFCFSEQVGREKEVFERLIT